MERFLHFTYDELVKRNKANLDIFLLRDESMEDTAAFPRPTSSATRPWRTFGPPSSNWKR